MHLTRIQFSSFWTHFSRSSNGQFAISDARLPLFRASFFRLRIHVSRSCRASHSRADTEPREGIEPALQVYETRGLPLTYQGITGRRGVEPRYAPNNNNGETTLVAGPQPIS